MDYKASGVDIDAGNETVRRIRTLARSTFTPGVLSDIGSFGGLFRLDAAAIDQKIEEDAMALARSEMGLRHAEEGARLRAEADAEALKRAETASERAAKKLRGYRELEKRFEEENERLQIQQRAIAGARRAHALASFVQTRGATSARGAESSRRRRRQPRRAPSRSRVRSAGSPSPRPRAA